ncbi:lipase family protein [Viridibacterium curvum]
MPYDPTRVSLYHPERQDTVFIADKQYSATQIAVEASRLAYVRAEHSESPEFARLQKALERVGYGDLVLLEDKKTNSQGFGCTRISDGCALLAFRGTQADELGDIAVDVQASLVNWTEAKGQVHKGFAQAALALKSQVSSWIQSRQIKADRLTICGHSLGAAIAVLTASNLRPKRLVTIGCPRVGDTQFVTTLAGVDCTRIVNCCDVITEVPPSLFGYEHVGPTTYIRRDGSVISNPAADDIVDDRREAREEYMLNQSWRVGTVLFRDLSDHAPINYVRAFFA